MVDSIGFDPVAWSVDGGRHPGDLLRLVSYAATNGSQGIVNVNDCKVHALPVPGTQVVIDAGALLILNRSGSIKNQTYVANGRNQTLKDVTATGPTKRSDLVIVRIEDPQFGWPEPADVDKPNYQYVKPYIIQNVSPTVKTAKELNLGYPAVALARIDIPPNTGTIEDSMIVDLRKVANPRSLRAVHGVNNSDQYTFFYTDHVWHTWPQPSAFSVDIPEWATSFVYAVSIGELGSIFRGGTTEGYVRLNVGNGAIVGDSVLWRLDDNNNGIFMNLHNADTYYIPPELRGTTQTFLMEGRRNIGTSDIQWRDVSSLMMDITFQEKPA